MRLKYMSLNRRRFNVIFSGACLLIGALLFGSGEMRAQTRKYKVTDGESFESLKIGEATRSDVEKLYGKDYKLIKHKQYSFEMNYESLNLSFKYCVADPQREIFVVEMRAPANVETSRGIILGESTLGDVAKIYKGYGRRLFSDSDQIGMSFFVEEHKDKNQAYRPAFYSKDSEEWNLLQKKKIIRINLIEENGLRQCDDYKSKKIK